MVRGLGLAFASKVFRNVSALNNHSHLSNGGNEICFCTIGDASTSEGQFWETMNAAGVLQVPLAVFVWDDGYGISVPKKYQTTKGSISVALEGMQQTDESNGIDIYRLKGWDYSGMCEVLEYAIQKIRDTHTPALFHIEELTQPQGHSTSGSHERYKSQDRLNWEKEWDGIRIMRGWLIENALATEEELISIENAAEQYVKDCKQRAWNKFHIPMKQLLEDAVNVLKPVVSQQVAIEGIIQELNGLREPIKKDVLKSLSVALDLLSDSTSPSVVAIRNLYSKIKENGERAYAAYLYNEGPKSALNVKAEPAIYSDAAPVLNGFEVINQYFDQLFANDPRMVAFGEDLGQIGDVNQGFNGLQDKYGVERIFDTGIRELTIMGQGIGLGMRGLRPIAEIQYLDYLLYGLQPLSDDVATLHYRTFGRQSCPLIVRTRGHRLEGVWHSGSPMGMIINSLRGMYVCVPRNMTQAAGMYNTLLQSNDPGLVIECLNGYRLKEKLPDNLSSFKVALGVPEIIRPGEDISIVSYGSTLRIVQEAAERLAEFGISCEIVDVQTLLPFDIHHQIAASLKKTNKILFVDEDVPGGASSYMFNKVMEEQNGYRMLDVAPRTLTAKEHRPAYGSDGDYFSKPNTEDVIRVVKEMMAE
jgi:pyruvate/2-oxoglutarate/acetoin dehydrogenase E1 component